MKRRRDYEEGLNIEKRREDTDDSDTLSDLDCDLNSYYKVPFNLPVKSDLINCKSSLACSNKFAIIVVALRNSSKPAYRFKCLDDDGQDYPDMDLNLINSLDKKTTFEIKRQSVS